MTTQSSKRVRTTVRDAHRAIAARETFVASALSGESNVSRYASAGRLDAQYGHLWASRDHAYVVWSYGTPIAWEDEDGKITIPPVSYSVTTSRHQRCALRGLNASVCTVKRYRAHAAHDTCPGYAL